jgi:16S rRNA (guanine966-N2)-methyltransferase
MADAGRVIAGTAGGRRLRAPGEGTRPLADRVKQTVFAVLEPDLPGAAVLDLCAGSGAAGIEALSRGARLAVFVERDAGATRIIEENLRTTGLAGPAARVRRRDALAYLIDAARADGPFDIVFADPPYEDAKLRVGILERIGADRSAGILRPGGRLVLKHFWRDRPPATVGLLASERERRYGETALTFYRQMAPQEGG